MANNTILADAQIKGHGQTLAQLKTAHGTDIPKDGELIITTQGSGVHALAVGDGSTNVNSLLWVYFDFNSGHIGLRRAPTVEGDFYNPSGVAAVSAETGNAASEPYYYLTHPNQSFRWAIDASTHELILLDITGGNELFKVAQDCIEDLFKLDGDKVIIGGATVVLGDSRITITAGTYNDLDLSGVSVVLVNTSSGDVTLNGFTGGNSGETQSVRFIKLVQGNNLLVNHNNVSGTQKIFTNSGAAVTKATYSNNVLSHHNDVWYLDE